MTLCQIHKYLHGERDVYAYYPPLPAPAVAATAVPMAATAVPSAAPLSLPAGEWKTFAGQYCPGHKPLDIKNKNGAAEAAFVETCKAACVADKTCVAFVLLYKHNRKASGPKKCNLKTLCQV